MSLPCVIEHIVSGYCVSIPLTTLLDNSGANRVHTANHTSIEVGTFLSQDSIEQDICIDDSEDHSDEPGSPKDKTTAQAELSSASQSEPSRQPTSSQVTNGNSQPEDATVSEQSSQSIEDMLLEFDDQRGLIRERALMDPDYVVEEDRIVGRDEQLQEVTKMLRVALGDNRPPNLFLYGRHPEQESH